MSLLTDGTIQIHNVDTQALVQTVPATTSPSIAVAPKLLVACASGFSVPTAQRLEKLRPTTIKLKRGAASTDVPASPIEDKGKQGDIKSENVIEQLSL